MREAEPVMVQRNVRSAFSAVGSVAVPVAVVAEAAVAGVVMVPALAGSTTVRSEVAVKGWLPVTVTTQLSLTVPPVSET